MKNSLQHLTPSDELAFLREIHGEGSSEKIFIALRDAFQVLQTRAQILLSLIVICLTITGFSGRQIAASCDLARVFLGLGILAVLASALVLFAGPLRIQWLTGARADTLDATFIQWLGRRNKRTWFYHLAVGFLIVGLSAYVLAVAAYLVAP